MSQKRRTADLNSSATAAKIQKLLFSKAVDETNLVLQTVEEELKLGEKKSIKVFEYEWEVLIEKSADANSRDFTITVDPKNFFSFNDLSAFTLTIKNGENSVVTKTVSLEKEGDAEKLEIKDCKDLASLSAEAFEALVYSAEIAITPLEEYITRFANPKRNHDIILVVGDKKFYVFTSYLATWSEFFNQEIFYGEWRTKRSMEFLIENMDIDGVATPVDPHEFETLLLLIHPNLSTEVDESNALFLLKLGAHFKMPSVLAMVGTFLKDFEKIPDLKLIDRLVLSDKHNLASLQYACLIKIHDMNAEDSAKFHNENSAELKKLSYNSLKNFVSYT